jgi:hypothetical protein
MSNGSCSLAMSGLFGRSGPSVLPNPGAPRTHSVEQQSRAGVRGQRTKSPPQRGAQRQSGSIWALIAVRSLVPALACARPCLYGVSILIGRARPRYGFPSGNFISNLALYEPSELCQCVHQLCSARSTRHPSRVWRVPRVRCHDEQANRGAHRPDDDDR